MHKKVIRGVTYYYTTVRENGRVKTIYLGRTKDEARQREAELKGIEPRSFPRTWFYLILIILVVAALIFGVNLVGYMVSVPQPTEAMGDFEVQVILQAGDFLPKDTVIEISVENQTSSLTLEEFLTKSGSGLTLEEGDFYSSEISLTGSGEGYGIQVTNTYYLNTSEFGIPPLKIPGTYNVVTKIIYNGSILEETSKSITLLTEAPEIPECEDKDGDGYDTCQPNRDCDDTNPDVNPGAEEICGNLIDEDCDGYDEVCTGSLYEVIASKNIKFVEKEVENEISRRNQARIIIKLKDVSKKPEIRKYFATEREVKGFVSAVVDELVMINLLTEFTEDDIELIQIDHPLELVLDDVVNQTSVWKVWSLDVTGRKQTVCVLDTGIDYNHTNLSGNYIGGYDFVNNDNDPMDDHGHGTYVSGIVTGIAKDSKILAVKVFDNRGIGYESDIMAGIDYCVNNKDVYNISVMLMSFGGWIFNTSCYCDSNLVANESNFAVSQGIFAVAASGNDGESYLKAPACGTNVTSVGAVDKSDKVAKFSNVEPLLDLLAPGVGVRSTQMGGGFVTKNGTSASAAVVAGIASLVLENESLAPLDLQYRLRSTGFLINHSGTDYPRVDAYNALVNNVTNTPSKQEGNQCEGTFEEYRPLAPISGGSGTTCDASNPCLHMENSTDIVARFDQFGYVDVKGGYSPSQSSLSPPANSFVVKNSTGDVVLYIDNDGDLATLGTFITQGSPSPSGSNDFVVQNSTDIAGYIDGGTGNMYFKGDLHYNSDF